MSVEFLGGSLKLKGTLDNEIKKKKKKSKKESKDKKVKHVSVTRIDAIEADLKLDDDSKTTTIPTALTTQAKQVTKTKAELAYEKAVEKRKEQRLLKYAELSHKERVENYNRQLDNLSEYNDVPKVSWTK